MFAQVSASRGGRFRQTKAIEPCQRQQWVVDTGREFWSKRNTARRLATSAARTRVLTIPAMVLFNNSLRSLGTC